MFGQTGCERSSARDEVSWFIDALDAGASLRCSQAIFESVDACGWAYLVSVPPLGRPPWPLELAKVVSPVLELMQGDFLDLDELVSLDEPFSRSLLLEVISSMLALEAFLDVDEPLDLAQRKLLPVVGTVLSVLLDDVRVFLDLTLLEGELGELERLVQLLVDLAKLGELVVLGELEALVEPVLPLVFLVVSALAESASSGSELVSPAILPLLSCRLPRSIAPFFACVGGR